MAHLDVEDEYVVFGAGDNGGQSFDEVIVKWGQETLLIHIVETEGDRVEQHVIRDQQNGELQFRFH